MKSLILVFCASSALTVGAVAMIEQTAFYAMNAYWSLEIDTSDGNAWIADRGLTLDDCAKAAVAARTQRPAHTGSASVVDIVCAPVKS